MSTRPRIAVLVSYSGDGGVERMMNILVAGFLAAGHRVDVIALRREGGHFSGLPAAARVIDPGTAHAAASVKAIARYLRQEQPAVLLAAKDRAGRAAIRARARAGVQTRVFVRIGNTLSQALAGRGWLRRALRYRPIRQLYPDADGIIAISRGVAEDVVATSGVLPERVHVAPNPVITADLSARAAERPAHPWFHDGGPPVVLGVGRLTPQKDFRTLLRAFANLRGRHSVRLLILGEGEERTALERLVLELDIGDVVDLPGFDPNPYSAMAHATLFVMSSAWEGFGNVLAEALAIGLPVVSTDCRSGPREILEDGVYGPLVPVGDASGLAAAMENALGKPPSPEHQRAGADRYTAERSVARYLEILGLGSPAGEAAC